MPWKSTRGRWRRQAGVLAVMVLTAPLSLAAERVQEIYVARGEHGEVSFSDEHRSGAQRLEVIVREPSAAATLAAERRIEQTLRVAKALEESRLARERTRAERRRGSQPGPMVAQVPVDRHFAYVIGRPGYWHRFPGHRFPGHGFPGNGDKNMGPPAARPEPVLRAPMPPRTPWPAAEG